ncbi:MULTISPECIES: ferredoxin [unclassified Mycobacterium]|uniref:ferredoxin n=1 Tax=unclassified Mycobacterium TaxID=2642494 RepID=UPI0029C75EBC|nr:MULTISPECIES: ferredoxin [unclassified Mycobacterium]
MRILVDFGLCESNGLCMGVTPEIFDLGDDDRLTVLQPQVLPETELEVLEAIRQCPRQAISLAD